MIAACGCQNHVDSEATMETASGVGRCHRCLCQVSSMQLGYAASLLHEAGACTSNKEKWLIGHVADRLYRATSKSSRGIIYPYGSGHDYQVVVCMALCGCMGRPDFYLVLGLSSPRRWSLPLSGMLLFPVLLLWHMCTEFCPPAAIMCQASNRCMGGTLKGWNVWRKKDNCSQAPSHPHS